MNTQAYIYNDQELVELSRIQSNFNIYYDILSSLLQKEVEQYEFIVGQIEISSDKGTFIYADEIVPLIGDFCLDPIPRLLKGEYVQVNTYGYAGTIGMIVEGTTLRIYHDFNSPEVNLSGDWSSYEVTIAMAVKYFVSEMFAVGQQFIAVWTQLSERNPAHLGMKSELADIVQLRDEALDAITKAYPES